MPDLFLAYCHVMVLMLRPLGEYKNGKLFDFDAFRLAFSNGIELFYEKDRKFVHFAKVLIPSGLCRYHRYFSIVKKANWAVCSSKTIGLCTAGSTFFMPEAIVLAS